jgi:hypothetical protein
MLDRDSGWDLWFYAIILAALLNLFGMCDDPEEQEVDKPVPVRQADDSW